MAPLTLADFPAGAMTAKRQRTPHSLPVGACQLGEPTSRDEPTIFACWAGTGRARHALPAASSSYHIGSTPDGPPGLIMFCQTGHSAPPIYWSCQPPKL